MTFRSISLLVPTRGQVARLEQMCASLCDTARNCPVELVFRIDDDDQDTAAWIAQSQLVCTVIRGPRWDGYLSLPRMFNQMAYHATGDLFMCGNDDMTFLTPQWPTTILKYANKYPDGIFDLGCWSYPAGSFPFSIVSRAAVHKMGLLNDPRLLYSDIFLRDVFAQFNRAIMVPEVDILHVGQADKDVSVHKWHLHTNAEDYWAKHTRCVNEAADKLRAA